jgi:hypothetical protein
MLRDNKAIIIIIIIINYPSETGKGAAELIEDKSPHYKHTPANVLENENFKLYWNRSILTDKTIHFNRPDITFMNKKTKKPF